ncbi:unnamed protein product [Phaeothamnion confervicola]
MILDVLVPWVTRAGLLIGILLLSTAFTSKSQHVPLTDSALSVAHLLSFSIWFGCAVWISFFNGVILMKLLDRKQFAGVVSVTFAAYFRLSFVCLSVALAAAAALHHRAAAAASTAAATVAAAAPRDLSTLAVALACTVLNLIFLLPRTVEVISKRLRLMQDLGKDSNDPDPRMRKLSKRFGVFHGMSNLCNFLALGCGVYHAVGFAAHA